MTAGRRLIYRSWVGMWERVRRHGDLLVTAAVALVTVGGTLLLPEHGQGGRDLNWFSVLLLVTSSLSVALRRRYPIAVVLFTGLTTSIYQVLDYPRLVFAVPMVVAVYTAVRAGDVWRAKAATVVMLLILVWDKMFAEAETRADEILWPVGLFGALIATAAYLAMAEKRALEAERTREEEALRRAGEERMRIARELHDVLAHNISLINVQAGVAAHLLDRHPEQVRPALDIIKAASKDALRELRATLGVLRQVDEEAPLTPTPRLAGLPDLVRTAAAAGLPVRMRVVGESRDVPPDVDLAAYRIVQESLTNAARHSGSAPTLVSLHYGERELTVRVDNEKGNGAPPTAARTGGAGRGIAGMRERATATGGELSAGPLSTGGFRVLARLPLDGSP